MEPHRSCHARSLFNVDQVQRRRFIPKTPLLGLHK